MSATQRPRRFHTPRPLSEPRTVLDAELAYRFSVPDTNAALWPQLAGDARGRKLLSDLAGDIERTSWRVPAEYVSRWFKSQPPNSPMTGVSKAHMYAQTVTFNELALDLPTMRTNVSLDNNVRTKLQVRDSAAQGFVPAWGRGHETLTNIPALRSADASLYRPENGPWLGSGREPATEYGVTFRGESVGNPDLGMVPSMRDDAYDSSSRFIWTCCGQQRHHPGCWIQKSVESDEKPIIRYDALAGVRGTAWLDETWYDGIHRQIVAERTKLGLSEIADSADQEEYLRTNYERLLPLLRLEFMYNQVHGQTAPRAKPPAPFLAQPVQFTDQSSRILDLEKQLRQCEAELGRSAARIRQLEQTTTNVQNGAIWATFKNGKEAADFIKPMTDDQMLALFTAEMFRAIPHENGFGAIFIAMFRDNRKQDIIVNDILKAPQSLRPSGTRFLQSTFWIHYQNGVDALTILSDMPRIQALAYVKTMVDGSFALEFAKAANEEFLQKISNTSTTGIELRIDFLEASGFQTEADKLRDEEAAAKKTRDEEAAAKKKRAEEAAAAEKKRAEEAAAAEKVTADPALLKQIEQAKSRAASVTQIDMVQLGKHADGERLDKYTAAKSDWASISDGEKYWINVGTAFEFYPFIPVAISDFATKYAKEYEKTLTSNALEVMPGPYFAEYYARLLAKAVSPEPTYRNALEHVLATKLNVPVQLTDEENVQLFLIRLGRVAEPIAVTDGKSVDELVKMAIDGRLPIDELSTILKDKPDITFAVLVDFISRTKLSGGKNNKSGKTDVIVKYVKEERIRRAQEAAQQTEAERLRREQQAETERLRREQQTEAERLRREQQAETERLRRENQTADDTANAVKTNKMNTDVTNWIELDEAVAFISQEQSAKGLNEKGGLAAYLDDNPLPSNRVDALKEAMILTENGKVPVMFSSALSPMDPYLYLYIPKDVPAKPIQKTWKAFYTYLLYQNTARDDEKWKELVATWPEYREAIGLQPKSVKLGTTFETYDIMSRKTKMPTIPTDETVALIPANMIKWVANSCWADAPFTAMMLYPGTSLMREIFAATVLYVPKVTVTYRGGSVAETEKATCAEDDVEKVHTSLIDDIIAAQNPARQTTAVNACKLSVRENWLNCFNPVLYTTGGFLNAIGFIESLKTLYQLKTLEVLDLATIGEATQVPPTVAPATKMIIMSDFLDPRLHPISGDFVCTGIIAFSTNHFISYTYDVRAEKWVYLDAIGSVYRLYNPLPTNILQQADDGAPEFKAVAFVFMRISELLPLRAGFTADGPYRATWTDVNDAILPTIVQPTTVVTPAVVQPVVVTPAVVPGNVTLPMRTNPDEVQPDVAYWENQTVLAATIASKFVKDAKNDNAKDIYGTIRRRMYGLLRAKDSTTLAPDFIDALSRDNAEMILNALRVELATPKNDRDARTFKAQITKWVADNRKPPTPALKPKWPENDGDKDKTCAFLNIMRAPETTHMYAMSVFGNAINGDYLPTDLRDFLQGPDFIDIFKEPKNWDALRKVFDILQASYCESAATFTVTAEAVEAFEKVRTALKNAEAKTSPVKPEPGQMSTNPIGQKQLTLANESFTYDSVKRIFGSSIDNGKTMAAGAPFIMSGAGKSFGIMQYLYTFGAFEGLTTNFKRGLSKAYTLDGRERLGISADGKSIADIEKWNDAIIRPVKTFLENRTLDIDAVQYHIPIATWQWFLSYATAAGLLDETQKVPFWTTRSEQTVGYVLPPITNAIDSTTDYQGQNAVAKFWSVTLYLLMLKLLERDENSDQFQDAIANYRTLQTRVGELLRDDPLVVKRSEIILRPANKSARI